MDRTAPSGGKVVDQFDRKVPEGLETQGSPYTAPFGYWVCASLDQLAGFGGLCTGLCEGYVDKASKAHLAALAGEPEDKYPSLGETGVDAEIKAATISMEAGFNDCVDASRRQTVYCSCHPNSRPNSRRGNRRTSVKA
jgi:hypothetical protein